MHDAAITVYRTLLRALGPQHWWPGESPLEVIVGAVLVQNTAWKNVERAIENLRHADMLDVRRIDALATEELAELIRPAGYYRLKARRLKNLLRMMVERYDGSLEAMSVIDAATMRAQLLAVNGIGPETADSILLYAFDKPVMVVDAYTHRIWARHGWIEYDADYYALQEEVARRLPQEAAVFNELHALAVNVGHHWCKRTPRCEACPLVELLPPGGVAPSGRTA